MDVLFLETKQTVGRRGKRINSPSSNLRKTSFIFFSDKFTIKKQEYVDKKIYRFLNFSREK